ncbi:hypothetical protein BO70DRAFT_428622 [Aspergillus heteromorphus CBS 117.55]|uniref:Uncharacterized protein n=1 Tax=Aspergillus heteromorphus CBS 117.55 TaxID=1448321 RepID=A0A317WHE7_9EURO|nr:uncharacterized protein BO70DRAFT_428622 [Aspergillus heteromorphus CBS 117.55]PWY85071.1 hypothetical protein BO70DRAFT_428622 [Aspergillus heteromorphus CBS 117.55]
MWPPIDEESTALCIGLALFVPFPCILWDGAKLLDQRKRRNDPLQMGNAFPVATKWTGDEVQLWYTTIGRWFLMSFFLKCFATPVWQTGKRPDWPGKARRPHRNRVDWRDGTRSSQAEVSLYDASKFAVCIKPLPTMAPLPTSQPQLQLIHPVRQPSPSVRIIREVDKDIMSSSPTSQSSIGNPTNIVKVWTVGDGGDPSSNYLHPTIVPFFEQEVSVKPTSHGSGPQLSRTENLCATRTVT